RSISARLALALVALLVIVGCSRVNSSANNTASTTSVLPTANATTTSSGAVQNSYADVVARVAPAVVTVRSERRVRAPQQHPFMDDPFFREFFGDRMPRGQVQPQPQIERGIGSGVIV